jgi:hypothetical protein
VVVLCDSSSEEDSCTEYPAQRECIREADAPQQGLQPAGLQSIEIPPSKGAEHLRQVGSQLMITADAKRPGSGLASFVKEVTLDGLGSLANARKRGRDEGEGLGVQHSRPSKRSEIVACVSNIATNRRSVHPQNLKGESLSCLASPPVVYTSLSVSTSHFVSLVQS